MKKLFPFRLQIKLGIVEDWDLRNCFLSGATCINEFRSGNYEALKQQSSDSNSGTRENLNFCAQYILCAKIKNAFFPFFLSFLYQYKMLKVTKYHIPHHIDTRQCISMLPSCICIDLQYSLSCSHSIATPLMTHWPLVRWSIVVSSCLDLPIPNFQELACLGKHVAYCPNSDPLGKLPFKCAAKELLWLVEEHPLPFPSW